MQLKLYSLQASGQDEAKCTRKPKEHTAITTTVRITWFCLEVSGWHVCRAKLARMMFLSYESAYEKCSEICPTFLCGSENPAKFPPNLQDCKIKEFTDELLQVRREKEVWYIRQHGWFQLFSLLWAEDGPNESEYAFAYLQPKPIAKK